MNEPDPRKARWSIERLLMSSPTTIVTGSDVLAGAVYAAAGRHGRRIGSDLAVTGFDGGMLGRLLTPALTTLAMPVGYIAETLVIRALAEIGGRTGDPGELVRAELVIGASSGPFHCGPGDSMVHNGALANSCQCSLNRRATIAP